MSNSEGGGAAGAHAEEITNFRSTWRSLARSSEPRNAYLTALNGSLVGRTYRIGTGRLFIGRADDCEIALKDDGVSRRHALIVSSPDGTIVAEDLHSTNGSMVDGEIFGVHQLMGGERLQFGSKTVFKFEYRDAIEERFATHLYESATQDRLTGVFNDRYLREQLTSEFAWHRRHGLPLALIFLDLDHFKEINDEYGHLSGDEVLRQVARRCHIESRTEDVFARYGGEEFACLLRRTPMSAAMTIAERMRAAVESEPVSFRSPGGTRSIRVTLSAGVAETGPGIDSPEELVAEADRRLYEAKAGGRNLVLPKPGPIA
ncbi:MAG: diguanylate cyclase [Gammaproteobacteria bacterium]